MQTASGNRARHLIVISVTVAIALVGIVITAIAAYQGALLADDLIATDHGDRVTPEQSAQYATIAVGAAITVLALAVAGVTAARLTRARGEGPAVGGHRNTL